jgi:glycine/D-amino acid oxidase-like deaminating enzyme
MNHRKAHARTGDTRIGDHAVVLGASMSGLLAARVLADAYHRVTVLDRDVLPEHATDRRGVPQGRHAHTLLPRGAQVIEELFPGILTDLTAAGVPALSHPREFWFAVGGHVLCLSSEASDPLYQPSRVFLEAQVRRRVRALGNVTIRDRCAVTGLVTTPARDRVTGARVQPADGGAEEVLAAWQLTTGADLAAVAAPRPAPARAISAYIARLQAAAERDPVLAGQFLRVTGLLDPPASLLRPGMLRRVLTGNLRRHASPPAANGPAPSPITEVTR